MIKKEPLTFTPYLKEVIWGGNKICQYKGLPIVDSHFGESWEISAVPGHESIVNNGEYKGMTLSRLIELFGEELLGKRVVKKYGNKFPLLIKFIDANDNLSVQVHPDDRLAKQRHSSLGKTEMWYIISTEKDSKIFAGLKIKMTPEEYVSRVKEGTFTDALAVHDSHPEDVFFLPAGRVHAIGAGNFLAEIQESSDITYRIYDYNRKDKDGNTRELHTHLAKDAIDFNVYPDYKNPPIDESVNVANLVECDHFKTSRVKVDDEITLSLDSDSFSVLICVKGRVTLHYQDGKLELKEGQTVLLPASIETISLVGNGKLLLTRS